jgi:hypothetical protein
MGEVPNYITSADWANTRGLLFPLWVLLGSVLGFAGSMLISFGVIPSLAASGDLPDPRLVRLRPPLFVSSALFFVVAVTAVVVIFLRVGDLNSILKFRFI